MPIKTLILRSTCQDSVLPMRVSGQINTLPGVREATALMGTPSNQALLKEVIRRLARVLEKTGKPSAACCLAASGTEDGGIVWAETFASGYGLSQAR